MGELISPAPLKPVRKPVALVLIRRCNLMCKYRYTTSTDIDFSGELATLEIYKLYSVENLKTFKVYVLI